MKTFVMKCSALVIFCIAGLVLLYQVRVPFARDFGTFVFEQALPKIKGRVGLEWFYVVLSLLIMSIALWAFLPRALFRPSYIRVQGAQGPLVIDLPPLRRRLRKALRKLPGVARLRLHMKPGKGHRFAVLDAHVVLTGEHEHSLQQAADRLTDQIAVAAQELLGLRDLVRVHVHIADVQLEPAKAVAALETTGAPAPPKPAPAVAEAPRHPVLTPMAETPIVSTTAPLPEPVRPAGRSPLRLVEEYNPQEPPTFEEEVEDADFEDERDVPQALLRSSKLLEQLEVPPPDVAASDALEALPTAEMVSDDPEDDAMDDDPRAG